MDAMKERPEIVRAVLDILEGESCEDASAVISSVKWAIDTEHFNAGNAARFSGAELRAQLVDATKPPTVTLGEKIRKAFASGAMDATMCQNYVLKPPA